MDNEIEKKHGGDGRGKQSSSTVHLHSYRNTELIDYSLEAREAQFLPPNYLSSHWHCSEA